ncbi:Mur ligase family protein [Methanobrevibacter sp.]|uniref:Mur ligase family protein n=1 Tax=Methanobrevibacter sp. TaxID=66852 RepID=UPI002E793B17|nr:Mur ligase family protein [Methanobrevibacter sp.]MEE1335564.1 Mur ligase family protein [Methanobrevibacter sp.]
MNYLVVGAGNASKPVARLLNYLGHKVIITDLKEISEFKPIYQTWLHKMESEGIILDLNNPEPTLEGIEAVYMPPTLPDDVPIAKLIAESDVKVLTNEDFSQTVNDLVPVDIIGITGSMGKTTTTMLITSVFKAAGYDVWSCSSLANNLVSETIIDGIITGKAKNCDIAVFELPHGTLGLLKKLDIKVGVLSYLTEEHLNEFGGSYENYILRKLIIQDISEKFIANAECMYETDLLRDDTIFYTMGDDADFKGTMGDKSLTVTYDGGQFTTPFNMMSYFFENAVGATAVGLNCGISEDDIIKALSTFKGISAHMEDYGDYNGRQVIIDAAFLPDGMRATLDYFEGESLVVFLDHFDTSWVRDKEEVGRILDEYDNIKAVLASGFDESIQKTEIHIAYEILDAITNEKMIKVATDTLEEAAELSFKYSEPGDVILHIGPLISFDRVNILNKIMKGLKDGSRKYE